MKNRFLLMTISSLLLAGTARAQEKKQKTDSTIQAQPSAKYRISFQPAQLGVQEFSLAAERLHAKSSLGILLAYRFKGELSYGFPEWNFLSNLEPTYTTQYFQALTLGITTKSFFSTRRTWYWEGQLFLRHWWEKRYIEYQDIYNSKAYIKMTDNYFIESIGVKGLLGYTAHLSRRGRVRPIITVHTGLGLRGNFYHSFNQTISDGVEIRRFNDQYQKILPSLHLGVGFGFEIFDKAVMAKP